MNRRTVAVGMAVWLVLLVLAYLGELVLYFLAGAGAAALFKRLAGEGTL